MPAAPRRSPPPPSRRCRRSAAAMDPQAAQSLRAVVHDCLAKHM